MKILYYCMGFLCLLTFTGCSSKIVVSHRPKTVTITKKPKYKAPVLKYLHIREKTLRGKSAFYPLPLPLDALAARLFIIDHAVSSIDVQYYIYEDDLVGQLISTHLLMAAQRGVRVRMLLDDLNTADKDLQMQKFASYPNIELRLFNPNRFRSVFRYLALLLNVDSLGKRMHNKSLIVDGCVAVVGGRNIGDVYFAATDETLFLDYDIMGIGQVVPEISKAFDLYWNSKQSVPYEDIVSPSNGEKLKEALKEHRGNVAHTHLVKALKDSNFSKKISMHPLELSVTKKIHFYYDYPDKVDKNTTHKHLYISQQVSQNLMNINSELIIISPYFIPSDRLINTMKKLREKGIKITIVTNSLSSTDVLPVYAGYQNFIRALLELGVDLYELKSHSLDNLVKNKRGKSQKIPMISLHTKMMLLDDDKLGVGSANIDPRSNTLNTELFMVIASKELTQSQKNLIGNVLNLKYMYKLSWGVYPKAYKDENMRFGPIWTTLENGRIKRFYGKPEVGFWKKIMTDILSILPIEGYL